MSRRPTWCVVVLALGLGAIAGCGNERSSERRDAGPDRRSARDAAAPTKSKKDARAEPRPVLPEATLAAVQGDVKLDSRTRVVLQRRRLVDGGVASETPDAGAALGIAPARDGAEVQIGDAIVTGADGTVDLELPDGQGRVALGPNTVASISRFTVNEIILVRGRLRAALETPGRGRRVMKVATPTALVTLQGNGAVVAVGDDGSTRVVAIQGTAKLRVASPRDEVELAEGKAVEVNVEGAAGAPADSTGDPVVGGDEWLEGRRALVSGDAPAVLRKIARRMQEDLGAADTAFEDLRERREKNRDLLKKSTEARAKRAPNVTQLQEELGQNSRTLVEATDLARSLAMRILLRADVIKGIRERAGPDARLGPAAGQFDAMEPRISAIRTQAEAQFRRFPRRQRRERPMIGPGKGLPRLPPLKGATQAPREPPGAADEG